MAPSVIICIPDFGGDPSETAIPWKHLTEKGWKVEFATEHGKVSQCDPKMLAGALSTLLGAKAPAKVAYKEMTESASWKAPLSWSDPSFSLMSYDVLLLPGGHDKGVKQIIESEAIRPHLREFFPLTQGSESKKICAAICHGVMVLAWTKDDQGHSLLYERQTTTLPEHMEKAAYLATVGVLGDYYRTYPGQYTAGLVRDSLKDPKQYIPGPYNLTGSYDKKVAHVVTDGRYISARWPGDAELFSEKIVEEATKVGLA